MLINKLYHRLILEPKLRRENRTAAEYWERQLLAESAAPSNSPLEHALSWLLVAQANPSHEGLGFDRAYNLLNKAWERPYPETTGYIISTLLECSKHAPELSLDTHAREAGKWLESVQFESGAICAKQWFIGNNQPSVFNTGMVLHGFTSLLEHQKNNEFELAAEKAAVWLMDNQDLDGAWRQHAYMRLPHTYYTMVAWALARFGKLTGNKEALESSHRNLQWALSHQEENGWVDLMNFDSSRTATTHTIAYCAQGFAECAAILEESAYSKAAFSIVAPLNEAFNQSGFLSGAFDSGWKPIKMRYKNLLNQTIETRSWECLTGTAQTSCTNWRLGEVTTSLTKEGQKMNEHLRKRQLLFPDDRNIHGAISGSWPLDGPYDTLCLPNHAAKFFIDALRFEKEAE